MKSMLDRVSKPDGGFTYQPVKRMEQKTGLALSPYPDRSRAVKATDFKLKDLVKYAKDNKAMFKDPKNHVGLWHDPASGMIFMDVSVVVQDRKMAVALCKKHDQIAYFDFSAGKSVTVNRNAKSGTALKGEAHGTRTRYPFD